MRDFYEALFKTGEYYLYVQHTADDPEYDFDYTFYDKDFNDVDGGVIGRHTNWDLTRAAREIVSGEIAYGLKAVGLNIVRLDMDKLYSSKVYL